MNGIAGLAKGAAMYGMEIRLGALLAGFLLDALLGDPQGAPHPVRAIGRQIHFLELRLRPLFTGGKRRELWGGFWLAVCVSFIVGGFAAFLLFIGAWLGSAALFILETVMDYYLLAARSLRDESMKVYASLKKGDLEEARRNVSMIVGRDTEHLTEEGIVKAAVETVAENTSDGVIAPLFYLVLGGPLAGWVYKAVNTMDSMVGYKNEAYLYFGRAAARLDDAVNFIPARLSAFLLMGAAALLRLDAGNAFRIFKRDRFQHKSPNSAQTEAACAGALGVRLAGDAWYFGKLCEKPYIGDELRPITYEDIRAANRLMYVSCALFLLCASGAGFLLCI